MGSFGKVKSSAKGLAFIGENAHSFFVKTDVNRPPLTGADSRQRFKKWNGIQAGNSKKFSKEKSRLGGAAKRLKNKWE
jgi:hypothetical protein